MNRKATVVFFIVIILCGTLLWKYSASGMARNLSVKTAIIERGDVKSYLSTNAVIKSKLTREYYGLQLKVSRVNIKIGDSVKKGQVLVTYDVSDLDSAIKQAQLNYCNAVLQKKLLENANKELQDLDVEIEALESRMGEASFGLIDTMELKSVQSRLAESRQKRAVMKPVSREMLEQAENAISLSAIALNTAKTKLGAGRGRMTAEFDGIITAVNAVEGYPGNPALPAVVEMDLNKLKAVISVGKYDASRIKVGQEAEVKTDSGMIKGKVTFVEPVAKKVMSPTGGDTMLSAEIDLPEGAEKLKVDFDTDAHILTGEAFNVVKVPSEAIRTDKEGRFFVYMLKDGKASEKAIKIGLQSEMEAEAAEGLMPGDKVILNPGAALKDGLTVREE
ncbi:MAG: efflux RND transporter periplasmic adaptor subunit [Bacillota bacterium]|nr:efflux RND transporter periplasmic adaptor subunit [Bacillota bacterium]